MWSWGQLRWRRGNRDGAGAAGGGWPQEVYRAAPAPTWRDLPPLQRTVGPHPVVDPPGRMADLLTSWRSLAYLAPLGHAIADTAPAGLVYAAPRSVPRDAAVAALLPRGDGPQRGTVAVQRAVPASSAAPGGLGATGWAVPGPASPALFRTVEPPVSSRPPTEVDASRSFAAPDAPLVPVDVAPLATPPPAVGDALPQQAAMPDSAAPPRSAAPPALPALPALPAPSLSPPSAPRPPRAVESPVTVSRSALPASRSPGVPAVPVRRPVPDMAPDMSSVTAGRRLGLGEPMMAVPPAGPSRDPAPGPVAPPARPSLSLAELANVASTSTDVRGPGSVAAVSEVTVARLVPGRIASGRPELRPGTAARWHATDGSGTGTGPLQRLVVPPGIDLPGADRPGLLGSTRRPSDGGRDFHIGPSTVDAQPAVPVAQLLGNRAPLVAPSPGALPQPAATKPSTVPPGEALLPPRATAATPAPDGLRNVRPPSVQRSAVGGTPAVVSTPVVQPISEPDTSEGSPAEPDPPTSAEAAAPEGVGGTIQPVRGTPSAVGTGQVAHGGPPAEEPEELLRKLFDPLLRRLKAELLIDRDRRGALTDARHWPG